ncbi:MAG: sensor histidine kinase [Oscillospiraceae bacterium]
MEMSLFDHFPEPVFYIQAGQIQYSNGAALTLEPEWKKGTAAPAALALEPDEEGVFSCVLGNQEFQAAATRAEDGVLLVLRRPVRIPPASVLTALPIQLRELINNIQAAARLLAPLAEESGDERARRNLAVLNQSFYRLLRLARHLELAERAGTEDFSAVAAQTIDLADLCREVSYGAARLAEQAGVTFREDVPGGLMPSVGDRELLEIMLLELISNAVKAAGKGGEAGIRLATNGSRAQITVWDNGPGMSQADLTAMLDGSSPDSLPKPGTGLRLGLPIARYAAAAHGGAILLESREGQGLLVTASLPLKKPGKGMLHTPRSGPEEDFPPLMTLLSDALPWQAFEE